MCFFDRCSTGSVKHIEPVSYRETLLYIIRWSAIIILAYIMSRYERIPERSKEYIVANSLAYPNIFSSTISVYYPPCPMFASVS